MDSTPHSTPRGCQVPVPVLQSGSDTFVTVPQVSTEERSQVQFVHQQKKARITGPFSLW